MFASLFWVSQIANPGGMLGLEGAELGHSPPQCLLLPVITKNLNNVLGRQLEDLFFLVSINDKLGTYIKHTCPKLKRNNLRVHIITQKRKYNNRKESHTRRIGHEEI